MNKKIIFKILLYSFLLIIVVPMVINVLYKFNSGICIFQTEWQAEDALSFYGDILGAAVAVIGVAWTINHERKERKKDNSILYKPILELVDVNPETHVVCGFREVGLGYGIGFRNDQSDYENIWEHFHNQQTQNNPKYTLLFKNTGRGETFNAVVDDFQVKNTNWNDISHIGSNIGCNQYIGEIIQNGFFKINVNLPDYLILPKNLGNQKWFEISSELTFSYSDMFNRIRYRSLIILKFKVIVEHEEEISPDIDRENYHYVKVHYDLEIMPEKLVFSPKDNTFVRETRFIPDSDE